MAKFDDHEVAANLKMAMSRLLKVLRKNTNKEVQLSLTERSTLGLLYRHSEMIPSDLAAKEKVTNQSMSQIIKKLSGLGYIEKTPSKEDKRKALISITPEGRSFVDSYLHKKNEWLAQVIKEKTTEQEKEILSKAILILTKLAD